MNGTCAAPSKVRVALVAVGLICSGHAARSTPVGDDGPGFYVSPAGRDRNPGTLAAPFATLARAQQAMRKSPVKTTYVEAGTYHLNRPLTLGEADSGETWRYYSADGVNTAVIDGGNDVVFSLKGVSNLTIDGLKLQNGGNALVYTDGGVNPNLTVVNSDIGFVHSTSSTSGALVLNNIPGCAIKNNYFHDTPGSGTWMAAFKAGDSLDGCVISSNVYLNTVTSISDEGAIYFIMRGSETPRSSGGRITIKNNFIRDYGGARLINDAVGIYLDDKTSNATLIGNIIGPPAKGVLNRKNRNNSSAIFVNGGRNNVIVGNIIDLGDSGQLITAIFNGSGSITPPVVGNSGNKFIGNIVISNFAGRTLETSSSGTPGFAFFQGPGASASDYTMGGDGTPPANDYFNYGGGAIFSNGQLKSDPNPQNVNPQIKEHLYRIARDSPIFGSPVNFPPIVGGWGPPGFKIPASTNHSNR